MFVNVCVVLFVLATPFGAIAGEKAVAVSGLPFSSGKIEDEIDKKQYAYTTVTIDAAGAVRVASKFSNGKQADGDHFVTYTQFLDEGNRLQAIVRLSKGLNGSGGGRAREGTVSHDFTIEPAKAQQIRKVSVLAKTESDCGDEAFWSGAGRQLITTAVKTFVTGAPPNPPAELANLHEQLRKACAQAKRSRPRKAPG